MRKLLLSKITSRSSGRAAVIATSAALFIVTTGQPVRAVAASPPVSYTYDASGRLASVTTSAGTATYHYDAVGNLLSITKNAGSPPATASAMQQPAPRPPVITSAGPPVVKSGSTITIHGQGFSATPDINVVRIGALLAPVRAASPATLEVSAPPGKGGVVRVTTPGGSAAGPRVIITEPATPALPAPGRDAHPLRAGGGVTALSGLVEDNHSHPLSGVAISVLSVSGHPQADTTTSASGHFLLTHLRPGRHQLVISGNTTHGHQYGVYAEPVELPARHTTVLPWITYLTPLDLAHAVTLPSPTTHQVTLTTPAIPGLRIQIPKGTVIRDHAGHIARRLSITPLTTGRTAYPLAPGMQPEFFTLQPGDATVTGPGLRVIYPNFTHQPPGTAIPLLIDSPNWPGTGWWRYGTGYVSGNGTHILPSPGDRWTRISLGGVPVTPPPATGPPPPGCGGSGSGGGGSGGGGSGGGGDGSPPPPPGGPSACGGDPVDLATGLYVNQSTDLTLRDVESLVLTRTFRPLDNTVRDFGIGGSDNFNYYIDTDQRGNFDLYLPDGGKITYAPTGTTGQYLATGSPTVFVGSTLTEQTPDPFGPFTIRLTNGTVLFFGDPAYLYRMTDRFGNSITINRVDTFASQILNVTTTDGRWLKFTYSTCVSDGVMCVTQVQDNSGRTVHYTYDANARLITVTDPAGGTTHYTWGAAPCPLPPSPPTTCTELLSVTDPNGHVTTNTYDPVTGRITGQTDGAGGKWSYRYQTNSQNQVTQATVTDPRGIEDIYTYDANGYPTTITGAAGTPQARTTSTTYNPTTSLLTSETDPLHRTTAYTYNNLGEVISFTELAGTASPVTYTLTYEPVHNRISAITDPLGHTTTFAYDDSSRTQTVTNPVGNRVVVTFNDEGQPVRITDPAGGSTYLSYFSGDLVAETNPLGQVKTAYHDSVGQVLQLSDPKGNTTGYTWTPLGQVATETSPLGAVTRDRYDRAGNLTSVTDANRKTTAFTYNGDNLVATKIDPLGHVTRYRYDGDQNLTRVVDAAGNTDDFGYDDFNNQATAMYGVSGTGQQTKVAYTYDAANRMTKAVQTPGGTYSFSYDGLNDVLSEAAPNGTVSRTFDAVGLPTSMTVPGQSKITYTYDKASRLTSITQGKTKVSQAYDGLSRVTSLTLPDGIKDTSTYNAASELTAQTFKKGTTTVGAINYAYTKAAQVRSESGSLASARLPAPVTGNTYNADNELTHWNGTAYTYNANGDLTSSGTSTYTWNAQNQLTSISGATTAAFTYNPFGQRATATLGRSTTSYLYDGTSWNSNVLQEQARGTPTANLLTGVPGQYLQVTSPGRPPSSLLTGPLGSTIALASAAGTITTRYRYTPYGAVSAAGATSPSTFEFNATQNDGTGLYMMGARYYDPAVGAFISQDPLGFAGGSTDLYNYAQSDPTNLSDPSGCKPGKVWGEPWDTLFCLVDEWLFYFDAYIYGMIPIGVSGEIEGLPWDLWARIKWDNHTSDYVLCSKF
jgi:RHS repeat-associated protein